MITLMPYQEEYRSNTLKRIGAFWGFHRDLVNKTEQQDSGRREQFSSSRFKKLDFGRPLVVCYFAGRDGCGICPSAKDWTVVMQLEDIFVDEAMLRTGKLPARQSLWQSRKRRKSQE